MGRGDTEGADCRIKATDRNGAQARGRAGVKWGVRPAELHHPPTAPRIVFTGAAAVSYRGVFAEGGWDGNRSGLGVRIERSVPCVCKFVGGGGGRSDWGAYGPTTGGNGLFSAQHMPSLPQAAQLPQSSRLRREIWFQMWWLVLDNTVY